MTQADPEPANQGPVDPAPADPGGLTADIERSRAELAGSVAELIARTDVRARARASMADLQHRITAATARLRRHDSISAVRKRWPQLTAAAATTALALAALAVRRRRR